ncbi:hypothetical protein BN1051_01928 [Arthrobacter saudimassiliensis]|uniref:Transcription termination factor Rho n=1 Tax=Arthrobacter saudimassiliensis TaxID=1461584 RepID=A0A078MMS1_9MICC|nr:hypothetical protein BN1051_01928 [Arthrobacter saudimassiliensis]
MTDTTDLTAGVDSKAAGTAEAPGRSSGLAGLKLAQLQALAGQLGITGGSRMRKGDLVAAISNHQRGGAVADRPVRSARRDETAQAPAADAPARDAVKEAPAAKEAQAAPAQESEAPERPSRTRNRNRRAGSDGVVSPSADAGAQSAGKPERAEEAPAADKAAADQAPAADKAQDGEKPSAKADEQGRSREDGQRERGNRRGRGRRGEAAEGQEAAESGEGEARSRQDGQSEERSRGEEKNEGSARDERRERRERNRDNAQNNAQNNGRDRDNRERDNRDDDEGGRGRNRRGRNRSDRNDRNDRFRDRNERRRNRSQNPDVDDVEVTEDDVLLPVAGILDVLENYAFVRTSGYLPGPNDVYVSLAQVKKHNLRKGDAVVGAIRAPREGENQGNSRQKFNALVRLTSVNGKPVEENKDRVEFSKLVPLYPSERLRLETSAKAIGPRVIDLVAPIGKGQRGLIVSPPKAGKTLILQSIANAITINNPEVHLMMVLVDERPEEVTDMQRTVKGEVIASTFDRPADDHTTVAELAIERAKRLVEMGRDVVVLLDSMTRLGRAYNLAAPASGRILSGGVDSSALYPPKRFFGAARNIENGGSLTILATALVETGSKMDEVIFEEFKGTGNMELRLSRNLADKRIFPAVDVNASGTRREENLLSAEEVQIMWKLRRVLSGLDTQQALEILTGKIKETQSNVEFLMQVQKTTLGTKDN